MCGIAGLVDLRRDVTGEAEAVRTMGATLAHRGPDAEGLWRGEHAILAHRRLIVVDPLGGAQPMVREARGRGGAGAGPGSPGAGPGGPWTEPDDPWTEPDDPGASTYVIVYNGELYNTEEIRRPLLAAGRRFEGYSDTEVLLEAFIAWGPACLQRLNGIFAFAVWDEGNEILFLARDRLGVKPLFYAETPAGFLFGSEMKAILAHPAMRAEVDAEGLAELLILGPGRTPGLGVFRGLRELRPAHYLVHNRDGTRVERYWSLPSRPHPDDIEATAENVRFLLEDAVSRQLISDVPISTFLSGGLDSSAVTAFAARHVARRATAGRDRLDTFSVDYAGNDLDFRPSGYEPDTDAPWSALMSTVLETRHHRVTLASTQLATALEDSLRANDLPGMVDVDSSLLLFCREVKRHVTVALSGEAADEVFGGYPWFRQPGAAGAPLQAFPWARATDARSSILAPDLVRAIAPRDYVAARTAEALAETPVLDGETGSERLRRQVFYLNLTRFMPTLLDRKDRMSMASGLEVRVPFCDHRLVEYVWNIPWEMKFCDQREKGILRRALKGVLPPEVLARRKSPYPKTHNPDYLAATRAMLDRALSRPDSPLLPLVRVDRLREIMAKDSSAYAASFGESWFGQLMGRAQLYAYLALCDAWLREYRVAIRL